MSPSESIVELVRLIVREELANEHSGDSVGGRPGVGDSGDRPLKERASEVRVWNKWLTVAWICPGLPVSFVLRDSVPWVVFMSAYAIIVSHLAAWRADEPTSTDGGASGANS